MTATPVAGREITSQFACSRRHALRGRPTAACNNPVPGSNLLGRRGCLLCTLRVRAVPIAEIHSSSIGLINDGVGSVVSQGRGPTEGPSVFDLLDTAMIESSKKRSRIEHYSEKARPHRRVISRLLVYVTATDSSGTLAGSLSEPSRARDHTAKPSRSLPLRGARSCLL